MGKGMDRKNLTFAQAEGAAPLPRRLELGEVSQRLRARLAKIFYNSLQESWKAGFRLPVVGEPWRSVLFSYHTEILEAFPSNFETSLSHHQNWIEQLFQNGDYVAIFDFVQFCLRQPDCPFVLQIEVEKALVDCGAAYTLVDDPPTIVPAATEEEGQAIQKAAAELQEGGFKGARQHLIGAAECLNANDFAGSVRESIHAVESVAQRIDTGASNTLGPALAALEKHDVINKAMRSGFEKLYGYTNTEQGIRHALVEEGQPDVGAAEATFMLGACASFVSYLLARGRDTGLLKE